MSLVLFLAWLAALHLSWSRGGQTAGSRTGSGSGVPSAAAAVTISGLAAAALLLGLVAAGGALRASAHGQTSPVDTAVSDRVRDSTSPLLEAFLRASTYLGDSTVAWVACVALGVGLWRLWGPRAAVLPLGAAAGAQVLERFGKNLTRLPRPPLEGALEQANSFAFPSAHVTRAAAIWLFSAGVVALVTAKRNVQALAMGMAGLVVLLVAASRIYLGVHWFSDTLAGAVVGSAWAALLVWMLRKAVRPINRSS